MMSEDNTTGFEEPIVDQPNKEDSAGHHPAPAPTTLTRGPAQVDLGDDAGAGLEDMSLDEQVTPFLNVMQAGSPQVKPENAAAYIPGLMPGMLYDTAAQIGHDALIRQGAPATIGCQALICGRELKYGVFIPMEKGGGFRGMLNATDPFVQEAIKKAGNKFRLPRYKDGKWSNVQALVRYGDDDEEVEIVETINYYLLYGPEGEELTERNAARAIMRFKSTSLQVATGVNERLKRWLYEDPRTHQMRPAQIWSYRWLIRTVPVTGGGYSWYNPQFTLVPADARPPFDTKAMIDRTGQLFAMGREFYELFRTGKVKVDETQDARYGDTDDEIPFADI